MRLLYAVYYAVVQNHEINLGRKRPCPWRIMQILRHSESDKVIIFALSPYKLLRKYHQAATSRNYFVDSCGNPI